MGKLIDLTGMRFGRLVVQGRNPTNNNQGRPRWDCLCDCGNIRTVSGGNLRNGSTKSCGCLAHEKSVENGKKKRTHGDSRPGSKYRRLYGVWHGIKDRCYNQNTPAYKYYGERGISVCGEWKDDYEAFKQWALSSGYDVNADFQECTLDRIDPNGDYCPDNCRWIDCVEQQNNRRSNVVFDTESGPLTQTQYADKIGISDALLLYRKKHGQKLDAPVKKKECVWTYNGETHNQTEWAEITGIKRATLSNRYYTYGWDVEKTLTTPVRYGGGPKRG